MRERPGDRPVWSRAAAPQGRGRRDADPSMSTIPPLAPFSVTVVEDEPMAQDVLVRAARSWHFECQAASTAEQALELLEQQPTAIVVTDLRMPGRGGLWLVQEIRRRWPDVGIIVLTAGHDAEATNEC